MACGAAVWIAVPARAAEYTFHKMIDSTGALQSFSRPPALNDRGVVVFFAVRDDDTQGVFAVDPEGLLTIADTSSGYDWSSVYGSPSINDADTIAFDATTAASGSFSDPDINASDDVVPIGSGGLYRNGDLVYQHAGSRASINGAGTIAFLSETYGPSDLRRARARAVRRGERAPR